MEYEIRSLTTITEFREHERLQREVWGSDTIDVPANLLAAGARHGAIVLGAFVGGEMIGLLYGFPGLTDGRLHHHSHMLGVLPEYRRRGLGLALKLRQRDLARDQGIHLITWTVDPLEVGNNVFNFGSLGVTCNTYIVDAYGEMDDALNRGLPSDRLEVHWEVNRPAPAESSPARPQVGRAMPANPVNIAPAEVRPSGLLAPGIAQRREADTLLVEAPSDFRSLRAADASLALAWRLHLRKLLTDLFARGYIIVGCVRGDPIGGYILRKG